MKKYSKAMFSAALTVLLVCVASLPVYAADSQDYEKRLANLEKYGFESSRPLTREEFCAVVSDVFVGESGSGTLPFVDSGAVNPQYTGSLSALYEKGYLAGSADNGGLYMHPKQPITRQDAFTFIGRILKKSSDSGLNFTDEGYVSEYARGYLSWFVDNKIITGYPDGTLKPLGTITAGEAFLLTGRISAFERLSSVTAETFIGTGGRGFMNAGFFGARFLLPEGVLADSGTVYVFDTYNNMVRGVENRTTSTLAGIEGITGADRLPVGGFKDGDKKTALLNRPTDGVMVDGKLYFCDSQNHAIRFIEGGEVKTLAGGVAGFADGNAGTARFNNPVSVSAGADGSLYVADALNNCIRHIDKNGNVTTFAGTPEKEGYEDGGAATALFRQPCGIAVSGGTVYVSDTGNHRIRKIENGIVSTVAGTVTDTDADGTPVGGYVDGAAKSAEFNLPRGIAVSDGIIVVADSGSNAVRAINSAGSVMTILGNGEPGDTTGGALETLLCSPAGVCIADGRLYVADTNNNKIKVMPFDAALYQ